MSKKIDKEFEDIENAFDKEFSKSISESKTSWHFLNLHSYLHQMTANRIKDIYDQLMKLKIFLLINYLAYIPLLAVTLYVLFFKIGI